MDDYKNYTYNKRKSGLIKSNISGYIKDMEYIIQNFSNEYKTVLDNVDLNVTHEDLKPLLEGFEFEVKPLLKKYTWSTLAELLTIIYDRIVHEEHEISPVDILSVGELKYKVVKCKEELTDDDKILLNRIWKELLTCKSNAAQSQKYYSADRIKSLFTK